MGVTETRQTRFDAPPRAVRFDETESAVTRRVFRCDGHAYEHMIEYDLAEAFDRLAYERKLDTFIEGFGKARDSADGRVYADRDSGHRVFRRGDLLFVCNVEEVSRQFRRIYFTVDVLGDILLAVNGEASRTAGGIFAGLRHDLLSRCKASALAVEQICRWLCHSRYSYPHREDSGYLLSHILRSVTIRVGYQLARRADVQATFDAVRFRVVSTP